MPANRYANVTEDELRRFLSGGNIARIDPEAATAYSEMFPSLAGQLQPWMPQSTPTPAPGTTPTTGEPPPGTTGTASTGGPEDLGLWEELFNATQSAQQRANLGRIPGAEGLEQQSSSIIAQLLNPPQVFGDVSRRAAEVGAGRGIPGSEAAFGTGLRMTDEERLRRIALGQQMLTGAYARNPAAELPDIYRSIITPAQQAELDYRNRELALRAELGRRGLDQRQIELEIERDKWEWQRNRLEQVSFGTSAGPGGGGRITGDMLANPELRASLARTGTIDARQLADALTQGQAPGFVPAGSGYGGGQGGGTIIDALGNVQNFDFGATDFWDLINGAGVESGGEFDVVQPGMNVSEPDPLYAWEGP